MQTYYKDPVGKPSDPEGVFLYFPANSIMISLSFKIGPIIKWTKYVQKNSQYGRIESLFFLSFCLPFLFTYTKCYCSKLFFCKASILCVQMQCHKIT